MKSIILIISLLLSLSNILAEDPFWELISMVPPRGTVWTISINEEDLIIISSDGGVYLLDNNTKTWNKIFDGFCDALCISENNTIFTRKYDFKTQVLSLYVSYDLGKTFNILDDGCGWIVRNGNKILKSLVEIDSTINLETRLCYYLSEDDINWVKITSLPDSIVEKYPLSKLFFKDSIIFQSIYDKDYHAYLVKTTDFGKTWKKLKLDNSIYDINIKSSNEYYIATGNGIYYTNDSGNSFQHMWLSGKVIYKMLFLNTEIIIASAKDGLYYTLNSGESWYNSNDFNEFNKTYKLCQGLNFDKDYSIYSSPYANGIYKSSDYGKTWVEQNNRFSAIPANDITFNKSNILISSWGMFRSEDKGINWDYLGLKSYDTKHIVVNNKGHIFVGDYGTGNTDKGVIRSTDNGNTWDFINEGSSSVFTLIINKNDILFKTSGSSVLRSTDNGETYQYLNNVSGTKLGINDEGDIFSFNNGTIYRSTDEGVNWEKVFEMPLDITYSDYLGGRVIFNNKTKTAWYGPFTNLDNTFSGSVKTTDNGRTWFKDTIKTIGINPENIAVDSLYCWITAKDNKGIYRSCDNGITWQKLDSSGLKHKEFGPLAVSPEGYLYIFGATGGLYRSNKRFVGVQEETQKQFELFNSPNPFTELTEIKINLPEPAQVQLSVFDIMGRQVFQKDYGWTSSGTSTILFDGQGFSSGVYYYRVRAGGKEFSGSMVLIGN